jgi:hypothetical protein
VFNRDVEQRDDVAVIEFVVHLTSRSGRTDEAAPPQNRELVRYGGLLESELIHQIGHAEWTSLQCTEETDSRGVSERPEQFCESVDFVLRQWFRMII